MTPYIIAGIILIGLFTFVVTKSISARWRRAKRQREKIERIGRDRNTPKIYNCARVYVGNYSWGRANMIAAYDTSGSATCGYEIIEGSVNIKTLRPTKVRGVGYEGDISYHTLETVILYPKYDTALIRVWARRGFLLKLVKPQGMRSTMFKLRL